MISAMFFIIASFFMASAHAQSSYPTTLLLSDLPDGARLKVSEQIELGTLLDDQHQQMLHYCTAENGTCTPDSEVGVFLGLGSSYNSQLNLQTDVETALKNYGAGIFSNGTYFLTAGTYCLDRSASQFRSGTDDRLDKLRFTDCQGNALFTIYARAGYSMRNRDGFKGYTVGEFHTQAGKTFRWIK